FHGSCHKAIEVRVLILYLPPYDIEEHMGLCCPDDVGDGGYFRVLGARISRISDRLFALPY
ncbi:MAG: hypothetical protein P8Y36_04315, partial [Alphaproteobacteria bacterium]